MMDTTTSREDFELAFAKKRGLSIEKVISMRHEDDYWDDNLIAAGIGIAWIFWKLSREKMAVELPAKANMDSCFDGINYANSSGRNRAIDDCTAALRSAGLTVKGD